MKDQGVGTGFDRKPEAYEDHLSITDQKLDVRNSIHSK